MKPFRLLKASELRALEKKAEQASASWAARWELRSPGRLEWTARDAGETPVAGDTDRCYALDGGEGLQASVQLSADTEGSLVAMALGQSAEQTDHPVARELTLLCLADYLTGLTGLAEVQPVSAKMTPPSRGCGTALLECRQGDRVLAALLLPLPLLQRMGVVNTKSTPAPSAALKHRAAAVMPARLRLSATLTDTPLTIKELREIAVGDVLILSHALNAPLTLRLNGHKAGHAHPGVQGGRLSVELSK